jgi:hypothetical protein
VTRPSLTALAMVLADHLYLKDNAFASANEDLRVRLLSAAEAVRDSIKYGITPGTSRRAQAIEARRAIDSEAGVVGDESAVAESDAPKG